MALIDEETALMNRSRALADKVRRWRTEAMRRRTDRAESETIGCGAAAQARSTGRCDGCENEKEAESETEMALG